MFNEEFWEIYLTDPDKQAADRLQEDMQVPGADIEELAARRRSHLAKVVIKLKECQERYRVQEGTPPEMSKEERTAVTLRVIQRVTQKFAEHGREITPEQVAKFLLGEGGLL